jgi:VCBS repeat-containing protein
VLEERTVLSTVTATQLVVTTQPPFGVDVGAEFGVTVAAEDDSGEVDASDNGTVSVSLDSNPAGAMLGGNLTATLSGGFATFTGLTVNQPGSGDALQLASGNLATTTTRTFDVVDAPVASVILSPIPSPQSVATASTTVYAPPGDVVDLTYVWTVNGTVVQADADTQSLTDRLDLSEQSSVHLGDAITVTVTPSDSSGSKTSTVATAIVGAEHHESVTLAPTSPTVSQTLSVRVAIQGDSTDDPVLLTYLWYLNGTPIQATETTQSLVDTLDLSSVPNARKGDEITVVVTPAEDGVTGLSVSSSVVIANTPPVAKVTLEPQNPGPGQSLMAVATASDADGDPVSLTYVWTDATTRMTLQTTSNTSALTDTLQPSNLSSVHLGDIVTIQATPYDGTADGAPATASATMSDTVVASNTTASLSHRSSTGIDIDLAATAVGGAPLVYSLVGADGGAQLGTVTLTGNVAHYTPTGTVTGTDALQFTASDGSVTSAPATVTVNLTNTPPVLTEPTPYSVTENNPISVPAPGLLSGATDADADPLTAVLASRPAYGTVTLNPDGSFTYTPQRNFVGVDSFTFQASDGIALSNAVPVSLLVADIPPVAYNNTFIRTVGRTLVVPAPGVLGNATDVNGNPLTAVLVSGPTNGALTLNSDGSFSYTPNFNFIGIDAFTFRAYDGTTLSNVANAVINITVPPPTPPPQPLVYNTPENVPLTVPPPGLLSDVDNPGNDPLLIVLETAPSHGSVTVNPDGSFVYMPQTGFIGTDIIAYAVFDGSADHSVSPTYTADVNVVEVPPIANNDAYSATSGITLEVAAPGVLANDTDVSGNALMAVALSKPPHGTVVLNPDGSFAYTPAQGFAGTDSFTYAATDGISDSNVATVTVSVTDAPPVARDDGPYLVVENNALTVAAPGVLANDAGTNGNALTAQLVAGPVHGTVTLNSDGSFVYTPNQNVTGTDSFTYQAFDGIDESNVATVRLNISDQPPLLANQHYTVVENSVLTVAAATGILAGSTVYNHNPLVPALATNPIHGRLTFAVDGSFVYTPEAGFSGIDSFSFLASDGTDLSNTATVSLTVTPADIPVAQADSYSTSPGTTLTIEAPGVLVNDTDPLDSSLTAVLVTGPVNGTLTLKPDGSFRYMPDAGFSGTDSFTYEAMNATNPSAPVTVTLTVAPPPSGTGGQPLAVTPTPTVPLTGRYTPAPTAAAPAPTPPLVTGVANLVLSRKGLTAITLGFNEAINQESLLEFRYGVLGGVKKQKQVIFSREIGTSGVSFEDNQHLTIKLTKPYKGAVQVWLSGHLMAANGTSSPIAFVTTVGRANGRPM